MRQTAGNQPDTGSTPGPRLRVSGLLVVEGRVLLVQQRKQARSYWLLPGGGVDRGEALEAALEREIVEECGIRTEVIGPPIGLVQVISPDRGDTRHLVQLIYQVSTVSGGEAVPHDPAVAAVRWFRPDELGSLELHPPLGDLIVQWIHEIASQADAPQLPFRDGGVRWTD